MFRRVVGLEGCGVVAIYLSPFSGFAGNRRRALPGARTGSFPGHRTDELFISCFFSGERKVSFRGGENSCSSPTEEMGFSGAKG